MTKRIDRGLRGNACAHAMWMHIGRRLRLRRTQLGLSAAHVADMAGISAAAYQGYESQGAQMPPLLLSRIADVLGVPVVWLCQGVAFDAAQEAAATSNGAPAAFRVATVDQRVQALSDSFRNLDLEGQQQLLAIAGALSRSHGKRARE